MKNLFFAVVFSFVLLAGSVFAQYDANTCTDGTPAGTCAYDKPKYCTVGLNLGDNIDICGCPDGMVPNIARTICISQSESYLVDELYFISGSPFDAYSVNPIAYAENPIYRQRIEEAGGTTDAVAVSEDGEAVLGQYLPKTTGVEETGQEDAQNAEAEAQETVPEVNDLDSKEDAAEAPVIEEAVQEDIGWETAEAGGSEEEAVEAGVADEQNMDSKEVVSEQIKSVYIKEEPAPAIREERTAEDDARDRMYMLVALVIIAIVTIYYWIMPKNL